MWYIYYVTRVFESWQSKKCVTTHLPLESAHKRLDSIEILSRFDITLRQVIQMYEPRHTISVYVTCVNSKRRRQDRERETEIKKNKKIWKEIIVLRMSHIKIWLDVIDEQSRFSRYEIST